MDHNLEGDAVDLVDCVSRDEVVLALNKNETWNGPWFLHVSLELFAHSGGVRIYVMVELCQRVLDGLRMPVE